MVDRKKERGTGKETNTQTYRKKDRENEKEKESESERRHAWLSACHSSHAHPGSVIHYRKKEKEKRRDWECSG